MQNNNGVFLLGFFPNTENAQNNNYNNVMYYHNNNFVIKINSLALGKGPNY